MIGPILTTLVAVVVFPFLVGYTLGCRQTDPETYHGKRYYKGLL